MCSAGKVVLRPPPRDKNKSIACHELRTTSSTTPARQTQSVARRPCPSSGLAEPKSRRSLQLGGDWRRYNDRLQTANPRIFAAGDVCSKYKFTHAADFMARIVIQNALFKGRAKASSLLIPWCTYTSPEIAHVGHYEKDAQEQGMEIDTYLQEFDDVDRAILDGEERGLVKVHVQKGTDKIVGGTIVAEHAGDMISELTLAMQHGIGLKQIGATIHPYPTQAEAIRKLGDQYNRTRLTPRIKWAFAKWLAWNR